MTTQHVSVLPAEVLEWLDPRPGMIMVDGTLGGGGHTRQLAERVGPDGSVIALDADDRAIERCREALSELPVQCVHANFRELPSLARDNGWPLLDGILLDLGLSSDQLADANRGFSFLEQGPLDLRFDDSQGATASELLQQLPERELADLIYRFGEERASRRIARAIAQRRTSVQQWSSRELAELIDRIVPRSRKNPIHPATRTFQALRIAVNRELESLELALQDFPNLLKPGGRLAIISFHSLEDRLVKRAFREDSRLETLTRKPVRPSEEEVAANPRSRSSRMRVAQRLDESSQQETLAPNAPKRSDFG